MLEVANEFFNVAQLPKYFTSSFIVLIPIVKNPSSFEKFGPIKSVFRGLQDNFEDICGKVIWMLIPIDLGRARSFHPWKKHFREYNSFTRNGPIY